MEKNKILILDKYIEDIYKDSVYDFNRFYLADSIKQICLKNHFTDLIQEYLEKDKEYDQIKKDIKDELENIYKFDIAKKCILLKGYSLELNYNQSRNRYYSDIDLLINAKFGRSMLRILSSNGYKFTKFPNLLFYNKRILALFFGRFYFKFCHHIELEKGDTVLELHFNINLNHRTKFNIDYMISTADKVENRFFKELNVNYNIPYLIVHMLTHCKFFNKKSTTKYVNIQHLYDLFYIISTNDSIDWNLILNIVMESKVENYYYVFLKIFDNIFKDDIFSHLIKSIEKNSFMKEFDKLDVRNFLLGKY